jgi:copper homeostasis protein
MSAFTFEICAANLASALAAQQGGGHRIELCAALSVGGLTPSQGLIEMTLAHLSIPVCVLVRPREGHFEYDSFDAETMLRDIYYCKKAGVHGIVVGALNADNRLDTTLLSACKKAAAGMELVLHRAFDLCADPFEALDTALQVGVVRILSSGQAPNALAGAALLGQLQQSAKGWLTIMPGGGITPDNLREIAGTTGCTDFHFSAKQHWHFPEKQELPGLEAGYSVSNVALIQEYMRNL